MNYYAAFNRYGDETGIGFANTWSVVAFDSRSARDAWVDIRSHRDLSARPIKRVDIGRYLDGPPKPFSGLAYCWELSCAQLSASMEDVPGFVGSIVIGYPDRNEGRLN